MNSPDSEDENMSEIELEECEDVSESELEESEVWSESEFEENEEYFMDLENPLEEVEEVAEWNEIKNVRHPGRPRFRFLARPGPTFRLKDKSDILAYFELFLDDSLLEIVVSETNRFANQRPSASCNQWKDVDKKEIMVFLAIKLLQGLIKKPDTGLYWSADEIWRTPIFPRLMSLTRHDLIKRHLRFCNSESSDNRTHPNAKLWKFWPIYEIINNKCSNLYIPERDVTINKSLLRLHWPEPISPKRAKLGIKLFSLCESKSGYIFSSIIYTGKSTKLTDTDAYQEMPLPFQIVVSLMEPLLNKGYCLTTDSYYTSPELANFLVSHNTDTYGVLKNKIPKLIATKNLFRGQIIGAQRGKVIVTKWKDTREVCFLSTVHSTEKIAPESGEKNRRDNKGADLRKPKVAIDYNATMGGVDRHLQNYSVAREREQKYYHKLFFHFLDICVWNAYVLYRKNGGKKGNLQFRTKLVESLIQTYHTDSQSQRPSQPKSTILRLTERHFPSLVPPTPQKQGPTRRCTVCSNKRDRNGNRKRKETRYMCGRCNVGLCIVPCFQIYHTQHDF